MKRFLIIVALVSLCLSASAQKELGWFTGMGGGMNFGFDGNRYEDRVNSHNGAGLAGDFYFGYWFNQAAGVRAGYQGLSISNRYTVFGAKKYNYAHADMLFRPHKNIVPYIHAGAVNIDKWNLGGGIGLMFPIHLGKWVSIVPDFKATASTSRIYDMPTYKFPALTLSATLGIAVRLGKVRQHADMDDEAYLRAHEPQTVYIRDTVTVEKVIRDTTVLYRHNECIATIDSKVLFDYDHSELRPEAMVEIGKIAQILTDNPDIECVIEGHTDNTGGEEYNQTLSEKRAKAVYDALVNCGIPDSRMTWKGFGFSRPVAPNDTPEGRQKNRRVEIRVR